MNDIIFNCVATAIEKKSCYLVNEYIKFWKCELNHFDIKHLDCIYYFLIHAHKNKDIDIFIDNDQLFATLFLV